MRAISLGVVLFGCASAYAQIPPEQLAKPPENARHFAVVSSAGKHGDSFLWTAPDGTRMGRESILLRGMVWETDAAAGMQPDGMPRRMEIRGVTPQGDAAEKFGIDKGKATWASRVDRGSGPYSGPAFYMPFEGPIAVYAWLIEKLVAEPSRTLKLLPGGVAAAEPLTTLAVGSGKNRETVALWAISGIFNWPMPVWVDSRGRLFAVVFPIAWLPAEHASELPSLENAQVAALAARMPALTASLAETPTVPVAFVGVKLFDAEALRFLPEQTVVVDKERIVAVGPAKGTPPPAGARVIDGRGKTLLPGLWDAHAHVFDDYMLLQALSLGVTSIRDPGGNDSLTLDRQKRAAEGRLLSPRIHASSLIDGKGPNTAQEANVATSEAEALALVRKAKENGFHGVKFYGSFNPAWLKPAVAEAHRIGLHVHGHVPQGMRPAEAVSAGYDEITHINWVVMQMMPDSVIQASNGIMRFEGPGRYAKDIDLDGKDVKAWIATLAARKIYSDPTMAVFENLLAAENGELSPAYSPFVGTLPPAVERGFRSGGFKVPEGLTRDDYRKSWAKLVGLLARMHKAGVPIVAGTDGSGIEIVRELEIYREAGLSPAEVLATATVNPARLVGALDTTGSIAVGKKADLVLVEGDPERRIGDLRQTRIVMQEGRLMDADALRKAAGFAGRPK